MENSQTENISPHERLARKFEEWQKVYMDRVVRHFQQGNEERGNIAFQSWQGRFLPFLEQEVPSLVTLYGSTVNKQKGRVSYMGQSTYDAWQRYKGEAVDAFLTQAIDDARYGHLAGESLVPIPKLPPSEKASSGRRVFIGHGRSNAWRDLKDFLQDRLHLEYDEFNRESTAGTTTISRLERMLEEASFAFLVMTAEDEHHDSTLHARENVIHEAGLFQGKLGFEKAIILLEEGCAEFSNIKGLTHIPFPKGNIRAIFEEIRRVLEREDILK